MPGRSRRWGIPAALLLLFLAAAVAPAAVGLLVPHAYSHVTYKPLVAPLEPCKELFLHEPLPHQAKEYTRHHMDWAIAVRQRKHLEAILHYRSTADPREGLNVTYASPFSNSTLQAQLQATETAAKAAQARVAKVVESMKADGVLDPSAKDMPPACLAARLDAAHYPERVAVSFVMQYFKQPEFPHAMVQSIISCNKTLPIELLVNVDHPQDVAVWAQYAANTSGLVIPVISDNIHEARAFNRLARMARGHIIITAQDDDAYPPDCEWLQRAVDVFRAYPKLGLLGLRRRTSCGAGQNFTFGGNVFHDSHGGFDFQFEVLVDASPFALRTSVYHELGGWDETQAAKGMCGIITDWELVLRVWAAGHWVGYLNRPPALKPAGQSNSRESPDKGTKCWELQSRLSSHIRGSRWSKPLEVAICKKALQLNCQLLQMKADAVTEMNETVKCEGLRSAGDVLPMEELQQQLHTLHRKKNKKTAATDTD